MKPNSIPQVLSNTTNTGSLDDMLYTIFVRGEPLSLHAIDVHSISLCLNVIRCSGCMLFYAYMMLCTYIYLIGEPCRICHSLKYVMPRCA